MLIRSAMPPRSTAYNMGNSSREAERRVRRAMSITIGNIRAVTPMLFIPVKPEIRPVASITTPIRRVSPSPVKRMTCLPMLLATPVRARAADRMNIDHTTITAGLLKLNKACSGVTRPVITTTNSTIKAIRSGRSFSDTNSAIAAARMSRVRAI